ncbi:ABC transporter permease [Dongia soli]|uniref:ABC transporter permease n=1 Tax=Dongia soli TaxID=600628 RepID=A0ABU5EEN4_9PROT|nr:ABC transporter permease [Dongia soli]MDY0884392.1 ABC transporter permease [Dongia soli]
MSLMDYISLYRDNIIDLIWQHLLLFSLSLLGATVLGIGLGIAVARLRIVASVIVPIVNLLQACPEIVLLAVSIPLLGIGFQGALIPLFVKGVLPILRNTASGLANVDERTVEAARGLGFPPLQILFRIELPSAMPVIISGIRVSAVMLISVLTLTAYIGVDSLGTLIVQGIARMDPIPLIIGSILTAILALIVNYLLVGAERVAADRLT